MLLQVPSSKMWGSKHDHQITDLVRSEHPGLIAVEMRDIVDFKSLPHNMEVWDEMALHGGQQDKDKEAFFRKDGKDIGDWKHSQKD